VGRFHYRIRAEESLASVAAAVANQLRRFGRLVTPKPSSSGERPGDERDSQPRQLRRVEQHERLAVQPGELDHWPHRVACGEVEGHDVIPADAVEASARSEAQSARPAELHRAVGNEDADESSGRWVVFADGGDGVWSAERELAGDDDVSIRGECQFERAEFGIADEVLCAKRSVGIDHDDRVVPFTRGPYAGGEVEPAVWSEGEPAGKGYDGIGGEAVPRSR